MLGFTFSVFIFITARVITVQAEVQCLQCSSLEDENCVELKQDETQTCISENFCYTFVGNNFVQRGCFEQECITPDCNTYICSDQQCNSQVIEMCIECNSQIDEECMQPSTLSSTFCPIRENISGCYRMETGVNTIVRGCASDLEANSLEDCEQGNDCKICHGERCNAKSEFQICYKCDSDIDLNCAQLLTPLDTTVCEDYMDDCKAIVIPNGKTERGCSKEVIADNGAQCPSGQNCVQFSENLSNGNMHPTNRRLCHQCGGTPDCEIVDDYSPSLKACKQFFFREKCYSYVKNDEIFRGCETDEDQTCLSLGEDCGFCDISQCNTDLSSLPPTLSCYKCNDAENCVWAQDSLISKCERDVIFPKKESCYTYSGSNVTRGCSLDTDSCSSGDECDKCYSDKCNFESTVRQSCVKCRSDNNELCINGANNIIQEECSPQLHFYPLRGCYIKSSNDVITRGCLMDLDEESRSQCSNDDNKHCKSCETSGCNIGEAPNGAFKLTNISLTLVIPGTLIINYVIKNLPFK